MSTANAQWGEVFTTTLNRRRGQLADNITNHIPLLNYLKKRGKVDPAPGGESLIEEIEYDGNSTYQRYSGYETLSVAQSQVISAAEYNWKQAAVAAVISGRELRQNSGPDAIINLMTARTNNAMKTMANNLAVDIFSDGTLDSGKQIGGLQQLVADDPTTGTVGGIPRASFPFWRNYVLDASSQPGGSVSASNVQGYFNQVRLNTVRNGDFTDLIICDANYYDFYWQSLQAIQRIHGTEKAGAGYNGLENHGPGGTATVVFDGNSPTNHAYFLNCDYLKFRPHRDANMQPTDNKEAVDQDAIAKHIIFMGNLTMSSSERHGLIKD